MSITAVVLGTLLGCAVALMVVGVWREMHGRAQPVIRPIDSFVPPPVSATVTRGPGLAARLMQAAARHPAPVLGLIESGLWIGAAWVLVSMALSPREGPVAYGVWLVTIGPHEMGHIICAPFGWFLTVAGGTIWQLLFYALLGTWTLLVRRQLTLPLLLWTVVGLSFMNAAPYIADARARELPLLFGMSKDHHDWWNLLRQYGLLKYDHTFAAIATGLGLVVGFAAVLLGLLTTWLLPRTRLGNARRYDGTLWGALRASLRADTGSEPLILDDLPPEADFFA